MASISSIASVTSATLMTILMIEITQINGQDGVALSLHGAVIANDGYVNVNDIGDEDYNALLCHTDKLSCCTNTMGEQRAGEWYYPNGTRVGTVGHNIYSGHTSYFFRSRGTQTVHLKRERHPSERGKFCCEVPNAYSSVQSICVNIVNIEPVVIEPFGSSVTSTAGMNFTLECSAVITPNPLPFNVTYPSFEWFFGENNSSLPSGVSVSRVSRSGNNYKSYLQFSPLNQSHAGIYTCQLGGNALLATCTTLIVNAMIIITHPMDLIVNGNDTAMFNITVLGESAREFTYQWQKNGSNLVEIPGKIEGVNTMKLVIKGARNEDEGAYWCVITNKAGDMVTTNEAFLIVVDLPVVPLIKNVSAGSTSITITWEKDLYSTSNLSWYELQYNFTIRECENYTGKGNEIINGSLSSYTLRKSSETPVEEDSVYSIILRAVNSDGKSEASLPETSTQGDVPTGAPKSLRESLISDRMIVIQWEPVKCSHRNGEITEYLVIYYPAREILNYTISDSTFTATGLVFDTKYVFEVRAINSYGAGPPANITLQTLVLQGLMIVYGGRSYQNNSIVNLDAEGGILQCFTNKSGCCSVVPNRTGEWIYPNGSMVQIYGYNRNFYRTRGADPGVVNLVWTKNSILPTGLLCCKILNQKACIGMYPEEEGIPKVISIFVDHEISGLVCTSTGGPATTVTWSINGQSLIIDGTTYRQSQRIINTMNATFENILLIANDNIMNYIAKFECLVMNSRGNDSESFNPEVMEIIHGNLSVGDNGSLICRSIIPVDVIEWLNSNSEVIISQTTTSELSLIFAPVNTSINNQMYMCRVSKDTSVNKTVIVSVTVEDPLMVEIHRPSVAPFIGERVIINCTATTVLGVSQLPTLNLTHPNGTNLSSAEGRVAIVLDPVHVTDAGEYTCTGVINLKNIISVIVQAKRNLTFKLPTPRITVVYKGSLRVGSDTKLNCTVTNYNTLDLDISLHFTWSKSGVVLSNDSDRMTISNLHESFSTSISQLILSPLSANDDNITCSASVHLATPNSFIEMSPIVQKHVQLNIEDPDIIVQIASNVEDHNLTAGTNFSLFCTIAGAAKLRLELSFEWMHFNGTNLERAGENSSRLCFKSLKLSDAGEYMCQVDIRSSLFRSDLTITSMLPYPVRVIAPLPVVTAILPSQAIFVGSSPNVTCVLEFDSTVDVPLVVDILFVPAAEHFLIDSDYLVHMESFTRYTRVFTISNIQSTQVSACVFHLPYNERSSFILVHQMDSVTTYVNISITASLAIVITSSGKNIAGEKYNLTCTVKINGSSDVPNISWNTSVSDEIIFKGNGTYSSVLQFHPLLFFDQGMYKCQAKVADITDIQAYYLTVKAPTVSVKIEGTGIYQIPGKSYTLSCSVYGPENFNPTYEYRWIKNNGTLTRVETNSSTLSFYFLRLSDIGWYTCNVIIDYTHLSGSTSDVSSRAFELQFSVPQPVAVELLSDKTNPVLSGTLLTLICAVELSPAVDVPVTISTVWTGSEGSTLMYTNPPIRLSFTHYISTAVLKDIGLADSGEYTCTVDIGNEITVLANYSVIVGNGMFQLRLKRTEDCQIWTQTKAITYRNNIENALVHTIKRLCRCSFPKGNLLKGSFSCDTSPTLTTYRSTLIGTHNFNATQLIGFIQDWVTSEPKIKMDWYTIRVDSSCPVAIASLDEKECD